jgi:hypothetical protein
MIFEIASKRGRQTSLNSFEFQEGARFNLAIRLYHLREQVRLCQKKNYIKCSLFAGCVHQKPQKPYLARLARKGMHTHTHTTRGILIGCI